MKIPNQIQTPEKSVKKMNYMYNEKLCTSIYVDYKNKKVDIENHTDSLLFTAFGVNEHPTFKDYEDFLERRCVPRTRGNIENVLKEIGVPSYDPLSIVEKTQGKMAEDNFWIDIVED